MTRLAIAACVVLLSACGQIVGGQHRLVGTIYEDRGFDNGFEMAFLTGDTVEVRLFQRTSVATCTWVDRTAEADARGENTTFQVIDAGPYSAPELQSTGEPAAFRIEVSCPQPMGSGSLRFELAFAQDLNTATRLQAIDNIGAQLFATGTGAYDVGRVLTRVETP